MAPKNRSALLEQLLDLDDPTPKDFDPEDEVPIADEEDDQDDLDSDQDDAGRSHYEKVGKSKLRKPEQPSLGPQYAGLRVSRNDNAFEDEGDDPFARDFESGSGDGQSSLDELSDSNGLEEADSESDSAEEDITSASGEEEESDSDASGASDEDQKARPAKTSSADVAEARKIMAQEQKSVATSISQAARDDAAKGVAVKKQRTTFDGLLNARIKLQKAMIASNTLSGLAADSKVETEEDLASVVKGAEIAALTLWTSLTSLRTSLEKSSTGTKRKHADFTSDTPTADLWTYVQEQDIASQRNRDSVLEKWYAKTHVAEAAAQSRGKSNGTVGSSVKDILANQLSDSSRLLKRARTPRSCAPYQLQKLTAKKPQSTQPDAPMEDDIQMRPRDVGDETVYDDADFYSVLLTTLLEQKSSFTPGTATKQSGLPDDLRNLNGYQIRREAKTKKVVDTKASKGRKLRYTVHEKLMNFCAPEDRGVWGERQVDELFSSLLGRRVELESESEDEAQTDGWAVVDEGEKTLLFGR
ncbi:Protein bfr2 [Sphaceloma murrayae]|uniref:Protein BFR2 n=1 Tax=Sphaceloma murrayae TaxID=2082308 RepID=A0A2K1QJP4_9PEZI|nr:Protein bfr2 [Sphaceloma murrayae]